MEFLNVFFGGTLIQDVKGKIGVNHIGVKHPVKIVDEEASKFLNKKSFIVNSYHRQGLDKDSLSQKLKPFAVADDGTIEGIYHPKHAIAGMLWHPERGGSDKASDKKLIDAFLKRELFWKCYK